MHYTIFIKDNTTENTKLKAFLVTNLTKLKWKLDNKNPSYVFIIGGDGSLLENFRTFFAMNQKIIFVPIKASKIGYYYYYNSKNIAKLIADFKNKQVVTNKIPLLEITSANQVYYALNEFKIVNNVKPIKINIIINETPFLQSFGSGIVIASSNGSSGYMKSIGGAVVLTNNKLIQLKQIAPVLNSKYSGINASIILDENVKIKLAINYHDYALVVDNVLVKNNNKNEFTVKYSYKYLLVAGNKTFFANKLKKMQTLFTYNKYLNN